MIIDTTPKKLIKQLFNSTHNNFYTKKMGNEFISEAMAEYFNSENPRDLCKLVINEILKHLK